MSLPLAKTEDQILGVAPADFTAAMKRAAMPLAKPFQSGKSGNSPAKTEMAESMEKGFSKSRHGLSDLASIA